MVEKQLSDMEAGDKGKVTRIEGTGGLRRRVMDMGIVRGAKIEMMRDAPLGDPLEFLLKDYNLTLRREEAMNIWLDLEY
ncbi:MAG: FeoA family protein [Methanosarcinaceae archaeon]